MECPVCDDVTLAVSSREGVEIDYCPQCRGVWLDRGELDKIIDRVVGSGGGGEPIAAPRHEEPRYAPPRPEPRREERYDRDRERGYGDDRYDRKRRRRSFLEDIFDFD